MTGFIDLATLFGMALHNPEAWGYRKIGDTDFGIVLSPTIVEMLSDASGGKEVFFKRKLGLQKFQDQRR